MYFLKAFQLPQTSKFIQNDPLVSNVLALVVSAIFVNSPRVNAKYLCNVLFTIYYCNFAYSFTLLKSMQSEEANFHIFSLCVGFSVDPSNCYLI